jgi:hypothetical protein
MASSEYLQLISSLATQPAGRQGPPAAPQPAPRPQPGAQAAAPQTSLDRCGGASAAARLSMRRPPPQSLERRRPDRPDRPPDRRRRRRRFVHQVLPHWHEVTIPKYRLEQLLQQAPAAGGSPSSSSPSSSAAAAVDADISALLSHNLLARDARVDGSYQFTLPNLGKLVKQVAAGAHPRTTHHAPPAPRTPATRTPHHAPRTPHRMLLLGRLAAAPGPARLFAPSAPPQPAADPQPLLLPLPPSPQAARSCWRCWASASTGRSWSGS